MQFGISLSHKLLELTLFDFAISDYLTLKKKSKKSSNFKKFIKFIKKIMKTENAAKKTTIKKATKTNHDCKNGFQKKSIAAVGVECAFIKIL